MLGWAQLTGMAGPGICNGYGLMIPLPVPLTSLSSCHRVGELGRGFLFKITLDVVLGACKTVTSFSTHKELLSFSEPGVGSPVQETETLEVRRAVSGITMVIQ